MTGLAYIPPKMEILSLVSASKTFPLLHSINLLLQYQFSALKLYKNNKLNACVLQVLEYFRMTRRNVFFMFSKLVGVRNSNEAEMLAILEAFDYILAFLRVGCWLKGTQLK